MQNLAALRAAVFLQSAKNHRGGVENNPPCSARVKQVTNTQKPLL